METGEAVRLLKDWLGRQHHSHTGPETPVAVAVVLRALDEARAETDDARKTLELERASASNAANKALVVAYDTSRQRTEQLRAAERERDTLEGSLRNVEDALKEAGMGHVGPPYLRVLQLREQRNAALARIDEQAKLHERLCDRNHQLAQALREVDETQHHWTVTDEIDGQPCERCVPECPACIITAALTREDESRG